MGGVSTALPRGAPGGLFWGEFFAPDGGVVFWEVFGEEVIEMGVVFHAFG